MEFVAFLSLILTVLLLAKMPSDPEAIKGMFACLLFFLVVVAMQRSGSYVFDTVNRRIHFVRTSFFIRKQEGIINFSDVQAVTLQKHNDSDGDTSYRIAVTFNNDSILLNSSYESYDSVQNCFKEVHEILLGRLPLLEGIAPASSIATTYGIVSAKKSVSLSDQEQARVLQMVAENRSIEAVKLVRSCSNVDLKTAKEYVDKLKG